jgi:hypothetical protein
MAHARHRPVNVVAEGVGFHAVTSLMRLNDLEAE